MGTCMSSKKIAATVTPAVPVSSDRRLAICSDAPLMISQRYAVTEHAHNLSFDASRFKMGEITLDVPTTTTAAEKKEMEIGASVDKVVEASSSDDSTAETSRSSYKHASDSHQILQLRRNPLQLPAGCEVGLKGISPTELSTDTAVVNSGNSSPYQQSPRMSPTATPRSRYRIMAKSVAATMVDEVSNEVIQWMQHQNNIQGANTNVNVSFVVPTRLPSPRVHHLKNLILSKEEQDVVQFEHQDSPRAVCDSS